RTEGNMYKAMNAVGFHEVVVFKDHGRKIQHLEKSQIKEIFDAYQDRYLELMKEDFVNYISIFHNSGFTAGASVDHPHSQIITTPLIHHSLQEALVRAKEYTEANKKCMYCQMISFEQENKKRVVFENEHFIAICPFASKT